MSDEAQVTAYVDGELDAAARAAFEARLGGDAGLRQRVARAQQLRAMLGAAYAPVLDEPVPAALTAALRPRVASLATARERRGWTWAHWGGMAASVALGLVLGRQTLDEPHALQAQGVLAQALDEKLSGESLGGVTPGLSFVARGGGYCRSFTMSGQAGLACRDASGWQLRQLVPGASAAQAEYRQAASVLPPALLTTVDELREGEVLDAQGEAAAKAKGWR